MSTTEIQALQESNDIETALGLLNQTDTIDFDDILEVSND